MSKHINIFAICLITMSAAVGMAQYEDRFDGTTSSNWVRESLLDHGSAEWSISGGKMNFFTGSSQSSENQVLIKYQNPFSNSQDWSFRIGMNNASTAQLQVFVGNFDYTDCFGVTLKGYADGSKIWGAEYPGPNYWMPGGITASASQQGSIKVDYKASSGIYSLLYANGGVDPISNNYSYNLLNSYASPEKGNVSLYIGMNTSEGVGGGQAYVDNFKAIPEPSSITLILYGLLCMIGFRRLCKNSKGLTLSLLFGCFLWGYEAKGEIIDPSLSHQLLTIQNSPSVAYSFKISQNTTTLNDWGVFLNSKAKTSDSFNLYKPSDFTRSLDNGVYSYSLLNTAEGSNPVRGINLYDAYRYVNWIENGANSDSGTENGTYDLSNLSQWGLAERNSSSKYFVQSSSEWLWAVQSINTESNYFEWTDTPHYFDEGSTQVSRGALIMQLQYDSSASSISPVIWTYADTPYRSEGFGSGEMTFRVAGVPEPSALSLLAVGLGALTMMRRCRS